MLIIIYILLLFTTQFLRFLCYKLGRDSTEFNIKSKVRKLNIYSLLNAIFFILLIPLVNDGTVLSALVNILNMILSGLIGYTLILAFKRGINDAEFEKKFIVDLIEERESKQD